MPKFSSKGTRLLLFLVITRLAGCASVAPAVPPYQGTVPTPSPTLLQAHDELQTLVQGRYIIDDATHAQLCTGPIKVSYVSIECPADKIVIRMIDTPVVTVRPPPSYFNTMGGELNGSVDVKSIDGRTVKFMSFSTKDSANRFADLWAVLVSGAEDSGTNAEFEQQLKRYLAANPKPELPEEARRYKVQAEDAIKRRDFENAADKFSQALTIAPWWPQGRYNLSLIYAELGLNKRAIVEMQRYLQLVPGAENARQAQDKIYMWEAR